MEKQVFLSLCLFLFILSISSFLQETEALKYSYRRAPITRLVSKSLYDSIFIHKENNACPAKGFYPYEAFVEATRWFPKFGSVGGTMTRRREVAAFLAQISHETTGGWATAPDGPYAWGLCFKEEVSPQSNYCDASNTEWPCFPGKSYKGRGPIQLSWYVYNINYYPITILIYHFSKIVDRIMNNDL